MRPEVASSDPPDSAEAVLARLREMFESLSPQLQLAARFLSDNPREIGVRSMRALAGRAEVHPNTLVRLAQAIGFEGYDELRERFRDFATGEQLGGFGDRARWLQTLAARGGSAAVMAEMAEATGANLEAMWRRQEARRLEQAADAILAADRVYVLGMGAAYSLAHQFWYAARMAFEHIVPIPRHGSQPIDDVAVIRPEDALIALTFQPYRAETLTAARHAKTAGATLIGITDSATSPLARLADLSLVAPTHTPQFFQSHAAATALLEGLLAVLTSRAGAAASERIAAFHARRVEAGLYEEPAPLAQMSGEGGG